MDGYRVGEFPPPWMEWNDQYRDDDPRLLARPLRRHPDRRHPARRLVATCTPTTAARRTPRSTSSPRTTASRVRDLVTYDHKHNEANGEDNRDGTDNNRSWNHGVEGETDDKEIVALRRRQAANLMATLCLSTGVPMITAGDERGRTQRGNNNAYCQDNEISWIDWRPDDAWLDVYEVTKAALRLRREHPALRQRHFFEGRPTIRGGPKDLAWLHPSGREMTGDDWHDPTLSVARDVRLRRPAALPRPARRAAGRHVVRDVVQLRRPGRADRRSPRTTGSSPARSSSPPTPSSRSARRSRPATGCGWVAAAWWSCGRPEPLCRAAAQPTGIGAPTGGSGSTTRFRSASVRAPERSAPMPAATTRPTPATAIGSVLVQHDEADDQRERRLEAIRVPNAAVVRRRSASSSRVNGTTGSRIASPSPSSSSSGVSRPTTPGRPTTRSRPAPRRAWRSPARRCR